MSLLRMLVKKAKEILNSSKSDQQSSTAFTQTKANEDLPWVFLHKRNQVVSVLLKVLSKSKIYST